MKPKTLGEAVDKLVALRLEERVKALKLAKRRKAGAMGASESTKFMVTCFVVVAWYMSNIGVLLLNKFLLSSTSFKNPVFLTLCHMMACTALGYTLSVGAITPLKPLKSMRQLAKVCLLASIFCVTIVLGNLSLKYIPVSFNQAIGATTPFFTAIFAFLLQANRENWLTYLTLIPIAGGVVVASGGEPLFNIIGFTACLLATSGRALKTVVQSMLLTDSTEKLDPMSLLFYMSSFSVLLLLPATVVLEPGAFAQVHSLVRATPSFFWYLLANSCAAYAVNLTNFLVTKYTSALTLQVLGNMKGVIAAGISIALFKNPVTVKGMLGYFITVMGVVLYSESKRRFKLKPPHDSSKFPLLDSLDMAPLLKTSSSGKDTSQLLPVSCVSSAALHGGPNSGNQHRKPSSLGAGTGHTMVQVTASAAS
eukprot:gene1274-1614_t